MPKRERYAHSLSAGTLSESACKSLLSFIRSKGMKIEKLPAEVVSQTRYRSKLGFWVCQGIQSWEGLVVGFPGSKEDLTTENFGTPFLRKLLYPMLLLHRDLGRYYARPMPSLYLLGERFNDVFLRKFRFLSALVPHVIVLSKDLENWINRPPGHMPKDPKQKIDEHYLQCSLCRLMKSPTGLILKRKSVFSRPGTSKLVGKE